MFTTSFSENRRADRFDSVPDIQKSCRGSLENLSKYCRNIKQIIEDTIDRMHDRPTYDALEQLRAMMSEGMHKMSMANLSSVTLLGDIATRTKRTSHRKECAGFASDIACSLRDTNQLCVSAIAKFQIILKCNDESKSESESVSVSESESESESVSVSESANLPGRINRREIPDPEEIMKKLARERNQRIQNGTEPRSVMDENARRAEAMLRDIALFADEAEAKKAGMIQQEEIVREDRQLAANMHKDQIRANEMESRIIANDMTDDEWECNNCTYLNEKTNAQCVMCAPVESRLRQISPTRSRMGYGAHLPRVSQNARSSEGKHSKHEDPLYLSPEELAAQARAYRAIEERHKKVRPSLFDRIRVHSNAPPSSRGVSSSSRGVSSSSRGVSSSSRKTAWG